MATQKILLLNWVVIPALGIWIWVMSGFFNAVLFVIICLVADKIWDWLTGLLITGAGRIGGSGHEGAQMQISEPEVPRRVAFMMIVDLLGTFILPWVIAGFFLGWYSWK